MTPEDPEAARLRNELVDGLVGHGAISSPAVERAFRAVPRHLFLPDTDLATAYSDESVVVKRQGKEVVSSSSQPAMMAVMVEQMGLRPGMRVLEIGAGSGYNAAIVAHVVRDSGSVVSIDLDEDIVEDAAAHLSQSGYGRVETACWDGSAGYAPGMPYDRIIVTALANDVSPDWGDQLNEGGIMVVPVWTGAPLSLSIALEKRPGELRSLSVSPCGFMLLRGDWKWTEGFFPVTDGPDNPPLMSIAMAWEDQIDLARLHRLLTSGEAVLRDIGGPLPQIEDIRSGLFMFLTMHAGAFWVFPTGREDSLIPGIAYALIDLEDGSATIVGGRNRREVLVYGGDSTFAQFVGLLDQWERTGPYSINDLNVRVFTGSAPDGSWVVPKRSPYTWVMAWGDAAG